MAFVVGSVVDGYRIKAVLGAGGMGTVYEAANPTLPRSDALKVLSVELSRDPDFRARFQREADLAATLDHPNILTVYTRGEAAGQLWIAMQFIDGRDADAELRAGPMSPARAAHIVTEVAHALDYAHRRHIIHRDVKPANFLIAADSDRVFLADFGIARALDETAHLTRTGTVMASIAYAAPESLSEAPVDHRADIYSLGASAFRLLTGKNPYAGRSLAAMHLAHLTEPPPSVTAVSPALPRALDHVIAVAMAKRPEDRYPTAGQFAAALTDALGTGPTDIPARTGTQAWDTPAPAGHFTPPEPGVLTYPSGHFSGPQAHTQYAYAPHPPQHFAAAPPAASPRGGALKRRLVIGGVLLTVLAAVAVLTTVYLTSTPSAPAYQTQTLTTDHGNVTLTHAPIAIAALSVADADAVLSLGLQPVAIVAPGGELPNWLRAKITGNPEVMGFIDTAAISARHPDAILVSSTIIDDASYERLTAIAPTITRDKQAAAAWTWQSQLTWIGRIVARDQDARTLIKNAASQVADLKTQNGALAGHTAAIINVTDSGVTATLRPSNGTNYLADLGMAYSTALTRRDEPVNRPYPDLTKLYQLYSGSAAIDLLVVVRTDKAAGNGGAAGLPTELAAFRGPMAIVDDPNTVAALADPGGYLATQQLNAHLVPTLADALR